MLTPMEGNDGGLVVESTVTCQENGVSLLSFLVRCDECGTRATDVLQTVDRTSLC